MARWPTPYIRFRSKIKRDLNGCWIWQGSYRGDGYGNTNDGPAQWLAWKLFKGRRNPNFDICHSCNNKACVNPLHLYQATHKINMEHAARDGLMGRPIVLKEKTEQVKDLLALGKTQGWIAKEVGVSQAHVSRVKSNIHSRGRKNA